MFTSPRPLVSFFVFFFLIIRPPPRSTPLSLHDALPIFEIALGERERRARAFQLRLGGLGVGDGLARQAITKDRKSTRLNSSHQIISYAVFCLKKKKKNKHKI